MSDLMKGTYTYEKLANQYGNFFAPAVKMKIGGVNVLDNMQLAISDYNISLSINSANLVSFQIGGAYDEKTHSFNSKIKDKFKLGTIVEIELGYLSKTELVFKGFVASMGAEFSSVPMFSVSLTDARNLMMKGLRKKDYEVKKYSDAVKEILNEYKELCKTEIEATDEKEKFTISQNDSDYNLITEKIIKANKMGYEFFVFGDKAYFVKPHPDTDIIMTVNYGRELLTFSKQEYYSGMNIQVIGYDEKTGAQILGESKVEPLEGQKKATAAEIEWFVTDHNANTEQEVKKRANNIAKKKKKNRKSATAELIGMPELVPGRYIKLEGMDDMLNGVYYIEEVSHSIGSGGFTTTLTLKGGS